MFLKTQQSYDFGRFRLEPRERRLRHGGKTVPLTPKAFDLLLVLVERHGHLVEKDRLMELVWPDAFVEDSNLAYNISVLRKALGEEDDSNRFIETVPKRGYRFAVPVQERRRVRAARNAGVAIGLAAILLFVGGLSWRLSRPSSDSAPTADYAVRPVPLAVSLGAEIHPSFSPDGTQLAFAWNSEDEDQYDIYVRVIGPGRLLPVIQNPADDISPVWSPDGRWIAFVRRAPRTATQLGASVISAQGRLARVFVVPALGGQERGIAEIRLPGIDAGPYLCWSHDGTALIVTDRPSESEPFGLFVLGLDDGRKRRLTSSPSLDRTPALSPDGRILAFARGAVSSSEIYLLPLSDRLQTERVRRLTFDNRQSLNPAWSRDGRSILFVSGSLSSRALRRIPIDRPGKSQRVILPAEGVSAPALARGARRLVYVQETEQRNIWRMRLPEPSEEKAGLPRLLISSTRIEKQPQFSPDGRRIAFGSNRSGTEEIWVCDSDGSNAVELTSFHGPATGAPRWSPNGRRIVFDAFPHGVGEIYVISAEGGPATRLTNDRYVDTAPSWSRDGQWIYFISERGGARQVWKMPADGPSDSSAIVQLTKQGAGFAPFESMDGKFVFYSKNSRVPTAVPGTRKSRSELWRVPREGGEELRILEEIEGGGGYALTDDGAYFLTKSDPSVIALKHLRFSDGKIRPVTLFKTFVNHLAVSPDSRWLLYSQGDQAGADLMLVENFR